MRSWNGTHLCVLTLLGACHMKALFYNILRCYHLVTPSCLTLCPPGSSVHGDSPGENTGLGCHALLQGICLPRDGIRISCIGR